MSRAKAIRGRIVRKVDPIQEKLGIELLKGDLVTLDGTVYLVGRFLDGGDRVELWRESLAYAPNTHAPKAKQLHVELRAGPNFDYDSSDPRASVRIAPVLVPVSDLQEASAVAQAFIRQHALGSGNWTGGKVTDASGRIVARVSYNGRLWGPDDKEIKMSSHTRNAAKRRSDTESRRDEVPIANPGELTNSKRLWLFHFGAYGDTYVYVWNDSEETAFEEAVEWLDEHAPGHLVDVTIADLKEAAADAGIDWDPEWNEGASMDDPAFAEVVAAAEADLTMIGHTTLKHGQYLLSHEWAFDEITDEAEREEVAVESFEWGGVGDDMLDIDYHAEGPSEDEPTSGLSVSRDAGYVNITEWTDVYDATGDPESEGDVVRVDAHVPLDDVLNPKGQHRGTYSGDKGDDLGAILLMEPREQEKAFVAAAIAYIGYYGSEESHVSYVGE